MNLNPELVSQVFKQERLYDQYIPQSVLLQFCFRLSVSIDFGLQ